MGFGDMLKINRADDAPVPTGGEPTDNSEEKSLIKHTGPNVEKVEGKLEWKNREEVIRDTERYFDAFVAYHTKGGYKKEDISSIYLYPDEKGIVVMHTKGGYDDYSKCPVYEEYKKNNNRLAVNDFNSLLLRLSGLRSEGDSQVINTVHHGRLVYIQKIGKYITVLTTDKGITRNVKDNNPKQDEIIKSCTVYLSEENLKKAIKLDEDMMKIIHPDVKKMLGFDD